MICDKRRVHIVRKKRHVVWVLFLVVLTGTACGASQRQTESEILDSDETVGENGASGEKNVLDDMDTSITEQMEDVDTELEEEESTSEPVQTEENSDKAPEDIGDCRWVYRSDTDIGYDYEHFGEESVPPCVDDKNFAVIREAYAEVEFNGEFETGAPEVYDEYRRRFWELLQGRGVIWDPEAGEDLTILKFLEKSFDLDEYDPTKYIYYFYDMDGDGCPDLGIWETQSLSFLRYEKEIDRFSVWYDEMGGWYYPLGTRKGICAPNSGDRCSYILLDKNADTECETYFFHESYSRREDLYMVMLPVYADKEREVEVTQEMKAQGAYVCSAGQWFFRVTEEQYDELTDPYFEAYWKGHHEREDVQYSYDELFGDIERMDNLSESE